jgi:hypothetical protein
MTLFLRSAAAATATILFAIALQACSVGEVMRPDVDVTRAAVVPAYGLARLVPSNPFLNSTPRFQSPATVPSVMPEDEVDCRRELRRIGLSYRDLPPIDDGGACRVDYPVEVSGLSGGIGMKPAATLSCRMALAFAEWTKNELGPAARLRYFSGVKTIHQGSSYSCRRIRGTGSISEHARGNALDVMRIELENGKDIDVRRPGFFRFREKGLLNNVRADACAYFSTVLGPGYDRDHKDHFHFDIAQRRGGRKACR